MAEVATPSQPRQMPNAGLTLSPPNSLPLPAVARSFRSGLMLDTFSPVTQNGSFEFDRIIKSGEVYKRTRRTKSWKAIYIVLRPNILSIYRDKNETKLRHQINLSDLTAVAKQKDPKRKEKHVFALFSPSRNYHLEARSEKDAQEWVELIRREAHIDEGEEEMFLASPGGAHTSPYQGFGRSLDAHVTPGAAEDRMLGYSSSEAEGGLGPSQPLPKVRDKSNLPSSAAAARQPSYAEYSGAEYGSFSDFSDTAMGPASRLSALSLAYTDGRPSTSSTHPPPLSAIYTQSTTRPSLSARTASQMSGLGLNPDEIRRAQNAHEEERVVFHAWTFLLKSKSGMRQWKKVWLVLRPKALALYKNEDEYAPLLILPFANIIDAVEIDPISRSKSFCMQIISEERNFRFCAIDEESLTRCLGALKSLLVKRKARQKEKEGAGVPPVAVNT